MPNIIQINNLFKEFDTGVQTIKVLKGVSFGVEKGAFVVIFGPSGCGKSTLLHLMLGLEEPTDGDVIFDGTSLYSLITEDERSQFRKKNVGMVYQQSNWIKSLTVKENVSFPLLLLGRSKEESTAKAMDLLKQVKMEDWADFIPTELSGGQQQRVALARALINDPKVIIADEPTGNLDFQSGEEVMVLLKGLSTHHGKTVIMVTHDLGYLDYADTAVQMFDGEVAHIHTDTSKINLTQASIHAYQQVQPNHTNRRVITSASPELENKKSISEGKDHQQSTTDVVTPNNTIPKPSDSENQVNAVASRSLVKVRRGLDNKGQPQVRVESL